MAGGVEKRIPENYGDDEHVADFGPDVSVDDIKSVTEEAHLVVGQRDIIKTVPKTRRS
jgi:hypothetical protein